MGGCLEEFEGTAATFDTPGVVYHPTNSGHADRVGELGLETLGLVFDPAWLRVHGFANSMDRPEIWMGGRVAHAARRLIACWHDADLTEDQLGSAAACLFESASHHPASPPGWLAQVNAWLNGADIMSTNAMANRLGLHPAWLAHAYRQATGEGLQEFARRKRVERALVGLRENKTPLADVAIQSGFCDQSHVNRCVRELLGATPSSIREEAHGG